MTTAISKIIENLLKPINFNVLVGFFLTCVLLFSFNFFPKKLLIRIRMWEFFNQYTYIIVIIMIVSFFLLVVQAFDKFREKRKDKKIAKYLKNEQDKLFNDPDAMYFLNLLYENHPNSVSLPIHNQKVKVLSQYKLIHQTSKKQVMTLYDMNNPKFPFVLQPYAEKKMKNLNS